MVGQLVPTKLQGIMMGTWMMISGIVSSLAHRFSSSMIEQSATGKPAIAPFVHSFNKLGMTVIGCAISLMLLTPMLNKLMGQSSNEQLVGV